MAENIDLAYLADRLQTVRKEQGKTLQEVADATGVSVPTLSRIERREVRRDVKGETLLALAHWLDLPAEQLRENPRVKSAETSNKSTPDVIELHLRADPKLNSKTAKALATMFRIAYEQMATGKKRSPER